MRRDARIVRERYNADVRKKRQMEEEAAARKLAVTINISVCTYGELERLAGVTDREAFWKGKTEAQGRAELYQRIAKNVDESGTRRIEVPA